MSDQVQHEAETDPLLTADRAEAKKAAVLLGRLGGLKGGKVRAERLTPERRREIARMGAQARWGSKTAPA